jgi:hypothetical protein
MMGTKPGLATGMTSVSLEAVLSEHPNGLKVIPSPCPNQFLKLDIGHALMRVIFRALGWQKISQGGPLNIEE